MAIRIKRVYDGVSTADGYRVLVDRLWPRGVSKAAAAVDLWLRAGAPSTGLRRWFDHDPAKWLEFRTRYHAELRTQAESLAPLVERARQGTVTLVYSARDAEHNQAVALRDFLERQLGAAGSAARAPAARTKTTRASAAGDPTRRQTRSSVRPSKKAAGGRAGRPRSRQR